MADAPLTERLAKFVRLLSSDQDGEVVAAAGAIRRVLVAANLDIHDLARVIERSSLGDEQTSKPDPASANPYWHGRPSYEDHTRDPYWRAHEWARRRRADGFKWPDEEPPVDKQANDRANYCYQYRNTILNFRETAFVTDMIAQSLIRHLTPRQTEWLDAIWRKCQPFNFDDVG